MRRLLALLVATLLLLATAACGGSDSDKSSSAKKTAVDTGQKITGVSVSGDVGVVPKVKIAAPLKVDDLESEVTEVGDGEPLKEGTKALLHVYIANGRTGKKAVDSYSQGKPVEVTLSDQSFFPKVVKVLANKPSGSRVVVADTVKDLYGSAGASQIGLKAADTTVFVIDIMSVTPATTLNGPKGTTVKPAASLPKIVGKGDDITSLSFAGAAKTPSKKLQTVQLVKGTGPAIKGPQIVTMDYIGQVYGTKKPFNNTYGAQPATFDIGMGALIKGWDKALEGQRVGSRVMLIIPPADGYGAKGNSAIKVTGKSTLVFVIDILGVG